MQLRKRKEKCEEDLFDDLKTPAKRKKHLSRKTSSQPKKHSMKVHMCT